MRAVYCDLRLPLFSSRLPTLYQVGMSTPLPLPPTIVGALAKAMVFVDPAGFPDTSVDRAAIRRLESLYSGLLAATSRLIGLGTRGTVVLKRQRALEGTSRTDAMRREYVFAQEIQLVFLFSDDQMADLALKALPLMDRIGDTESLASPVRWGEALVREVGAGGDEVKINTVSRASLLAEVLGGIYSNARAFLTPRFQLRENGRRREWPRRLRADTFYIPVRASVRLRSGLTLVEPSEITAVVAKGAIALEVETPDGCAVLVAPQTPDWV